MMTPKQEIVVSVIAVALVAAVIAVRRSDEPRIVDALSADMRTPRDAATEMNEAGKLLALIATAQERYRKDHDTYIADFEILANQLAKQRNLRVPAYIEPRRLSGTANSWHAEVLSPTYWCGMAVGMANPVMSAPDGQLRCIRRPANLGKPITAPADSVTSAKGYLLALRAAQEKFFADSGYYTPNIRSLFLAKGDDQLLSPPAGYSEPAINAFGSVWSARLTSEQYVCGIAVGNTENPVSLSARKGEPMCQLTHLR